MRTHKIVYLLLLLVMVINITGCGLIDELFGSDVTRYDNEHNESTGKWYLLDEENNKTENYFEFDGSFGKMIVNYYENNTKKISGNYRIVYKGNNGKENTYTFSLIIDKKDGEKEDILYCYSDNFNTSFSQFTIMEEEKDLGNIEGSLHRRPYRISELPFKMGTYVLEGKDYVPEKNDYSSADDYYVPTGTYVLPTGESFTFLMTKPKTYSLFQYRKDDVLIEGIYYLSRGEEEGKKMFCHIDTNPYNKVTKEDSEKYNSELNLYYPPDYTLIGNFIIKDDTIVLESINRPEYAPEYIDDNIWTFGEYKKINK